MHCSIGVLILLLAGTLSTDGSSFSHSCKSYQSFKYQYTFCDQVEGYARSRQYCKEHVDKNSDVVLFPNKEEFEFVLATMREIVEMKHGANSYSGEPDYSTLQVFIGAYQKRKESDSDGWYEDNYGSGEFYWRTDERIVMNENSTFYWQPLERWLQQTNREILKNDEYFLITAGNETLSGGSLGKNPDLSTPRNGTLMCQTDLSLVSNNANNKASNKDNEDTIYTIELVIIVAAVGGALIIFLIVLITFLCLKGKRQRKFDKVPTQDNAYLET